MKASIAPEQEAHKAMGKDEISFEHDILPIIHDHCLNCHMLGGKGYVKSGLDLRTYENLMKGTMFSAVVKSGHSETSTFTKPLEGTNKGLKLSTDLNPSGTLDRGIYLDHAKIGTTKESRKIDHARNSTASYHTLAALKFGFVAMKKTIREQTISGVTPKTRAPEASRELPSNFRDKLFDDF